MPCCHVGPHGPGCDGWIDQQMPTLPALWVPDPLEPEVKILREEVAMWKEAYEKMKAISDRQEELIKEYQKAMARALSQ